MDFLELTLDGINQFYVNVENEDLKLKTLCNLYETVLLTKTVIFVNTRRSAEWLANKLRSLDYIVSHTHKDMDQNTIERIMHEFRSGSSKILVTSNGLVSGIDDPQVSLVINYDLPTHPLYYLLRVGQSRRYRRNGSVVNLVTPEDERMLDDIHKFYSVLVEELPSDFAGLL